MGPRREERGTAEDGQSARATRVAPASLAERRLELQTTTRAAPTRTKPMKAGSTGG